MNEEMIKNITSIDNKPVTQKVTDVIMKLIMDGNVKVGDYLPSEDELCHLLNVGRSTLRESIKTLESFGMVRKFQGKGVMVVDESINAAARSLQTVLSFKRTTISDLVEFRNVLEVKMTELAAIRATPGDLKKIQRNLDLMKNEDYEVEKFAAYDFQFHKSVAEASGNNVFVLLMETIKDMLYDQIVYTLNSDFNPELSLHFHEMIYEAIRLKDVQAASNAMQSHLFETQSIIDKLNDRLNN